LNNQAPSGLVSVIIPAFNSEEFIAEAIESVLCQNYLNIELIVVIDGGSDSSGAIAEKYAERDVRVQVICHERNFGIAAARNTGIEQSSGRYLAFCDSDDVWLPSKLGEQLKLMRDRNLRLVHGSAVLIDALGEKIGQRVMPEMVNQSMMKRRNFIITSSALIDTVHFGLIHQNAIRHEDYDLWLRLFDSDVISACPKEPVVKYRIHGSNLTSSSLRSLRWMVAVQRRNNISWVSIFFGLFFNVYSRILSSK
jgi:teichuronic acid biosynthesis glycosyltransferase TuaG